jgi:Mg/Co/Ni transporter MgtE
MEHDRKEKVVRLCNESGDVLEVELTPEGNRLLGLLRVDGVPYHVEELSAERLMSMYCVDTDPDYQPRRDANGHCIILAPYSR